MSFLESWRYEKESAFLYRAIANKESNPERKNLFLQLASEAEKQSEIWLTKMQTPAPVFRPSTRAKVTLFLINWLGPRPLRSILSAMKVRGMSVYQNPLAFHATPDHLSQVGLRHHHFGASNWLRAAVFGANDGLVSNASLILGVSGASLHPEAVLMSGVAGMLAGACSMACGEFISMQSQKEFFEKQLAIEKEELESYPDEEAAELALIFQARGLEAADAERTAKKLVSDPSKALATLAREELGINPNELGSPQLAALSSFFSFLFGAAIPLLPFLFLPQTSWIPACLILTGFALFLLGCGISLFTGRSALAGGFRTLLIGGFAGAATYGLGWWLS